MSIRSLFGGLFLIAGSATTVLAAAAIILSMQMQGGDGLALGLTGIGGGVAALVLGAVIVLFQR